jgi:hypothetical protein
VFPTGFSKRPMKRVSCGSGFQPRLSGWEAAPTRE